MANNNRTSKSSSSNNNMKVGKMNWAPVIGISLLLLVIISLYYMKKSNDGFMSSDKNNNTPMKQSSKLISNTNISEKLNPAKGECVVALFYADWCPHCQTFKPHFKKAMESLNGKTGKDGKKMRLEMVDCDENKDIASKYDVSGYPTVKILGDDGTQVEYGGERTFDGLKKYLVSDD